MEDLSGEMSQYLQALRRCHLDRLRAAGITGSAIVSAWRETEPVPPIGLAKIDVSGQRWQPCDGGAEAYVVPVVEGGAVLDIVAWRAAKPDRWQLRTGYGLALGERAISWSSVWAPDEPLLLHPTPLEWLRSGGQGACLLQWEYARLALPVRRIIAADDRLGARIDRVLNHAPRVEVRVGRRAAA